MAFSKTDIHHLTNLACAAADAAAVQTLAHFRTRGLVADNKHVQGFDPVTVADRAAETAIRGVITAARPDDSILGEEEAGIDGTSGTTWVIDPIDGTRGFISGTPTWGTLIAVGDVDGPQIGVVDQPYIGERFIGTPDRAYMQRGGVETPLGVSACTDLSAAILFTTFPEVGTATDRMGFDGVGAQCKLVRYGMDCYAHALVAAGHVDLVIEAGLAAYDVQASIALVRAAGGIATTWSGKNPANGGQMVLAATPALHAAALDILGPYADD